MNYEHFTLPDLTDWNATPLGRHVFNVEGGWLDAKLPGLPGKDLLWIGLPGGHPPALGRRHHLRFTVCTSSMQRAVPTPAPGSGVIALADALPFAASTFDCVVAQHCFELAGDLHRAVHESARVLQLGGHLIALGFNPISAWGLRSLVTLRGSRAPWNGRFVAHWRLVDWLRLLGFQVIEVRWAVYRLPVNGWGGRFPGQTAASAARIGASRLGLPFAGVYFVHARKEGFGANVIRPRRAIRKANLVPVAVPR